MSFELWLAFVAASTLLVIVPGPTVLLVLTYALSQGRRVAVATALGVGLGDLIAMTLSLLGLGALILTSATLFTLVKWAGAIYLIWLGWRMLRQTPGGFDMCIEDTGLEPGHKGFRAPFFHATAVTALNPKSIGFFIAFVPQFLDSTAPFAPQAVVLIATFVAIGALNALAYALLADRLRSRISRPDVLRWLSRSSGAVLIAMGVMTATLKRAA